jgi:hypothetical protein
VFRTDSRMDMERSWLMAALVVGLLTTGFAEEGYADVIYFKPGINPTAMFPPRTDIFPYRRVTRSGTQQLKAVRGRIVSVTPGAPLPSGSPATTAPNFATIEFQPAELTKDDPANPRRGVAAGPNARPEDGPFRLRFHRYADRTGPTPALRARKIVVNLRDVIRIDHELDGMQDLRWIFSNRVDLIERMPTLPTRLRNKVQIGYTPFNTYFLVAAGVTKTDAAGNETTRTIPSAPGPMNATLSSDLQEGWLLDWLKNGPLGRRPAAAPGQIQMRKTEIRVLISQLLRAAAQDKKYRGVFLYDRNPQGLPIDKDGVVTNDADKYVPTFYPQCTQAIMFLCDLAYEKHPNANRLGMEAREAVLEAVEAATIGRLDPSVAAPAGRPTSIGSTADKFLEMKSNFRDARQLKGQGKLTEALAEINAAITIAQALKNAPLTDLGAGKTVSYRGALITPNQRDRQRATLALTKLQAWQATLPAAAPAGTPPPAQSSQRITPLASSIHFPVDPSDIASIAMEIIRNSDSWQVPQRDLDETTDREGTRLVRALIGLARDGEPRAPRSADRLREAARSVDIPYYGVVTPLRQSVTTTLEHLLGGTNAQARVFQSEIARLLLEGISHGERELASEVVARAGFADVSVMGTVIEGLFSVGVMPPDDAPARSGASAAFLKLRRQRSELRELIRSDAIASLARLAALEKGDAIDKQVAKKVVDQLQEVIEEQKDGTEGEAEKAFFEALDTMSKAPTGVKSLQERTSKVPRLHEHATRLNNHAARLRNSSGGDTRGNGPDKRRDGDRRESPDDN